MRSWDDVLAAAPREVQTTTVGLLDELSLAHLVSSASQLHPRTVAAALAARKVEVAVALAGRGDLDDDTYATLAKDRRKWVMDRLASNSSLPPAAMWELVRGNEADVNEQLWHRSDLPVPLRRALLSGWSVNPRTPRRRVRATRWVAHDAVDRFRSLAVTAQDRSVLQIVLTRVTELSEDQRMELVSSVVDAALDDRARSTDRSALWTSLQRVVADLPPVATVAVRRASALVNPTLEERFELLRAELVQPSATSGGALGLADPASTDELLVDLRAGVAPERFASGVLPWDDIVQEVSGLDDAALRVLVSRDDAPAVLVAHTRRYRPALYLARPQVSREEALKGVASLLARSRSDHVDAVGVGFVRFGFSVAELASVLPASDAPRRLYRAAQWVGPGDLAAWIDGRFGGDAQCWATLLQLLESYDGSLAGLVDAVVALHAEAPEQAPAS